MLTALVLVCAIHVTQCNADHARMVVRVPERAALPFMCLRNGQAYLAGSGLEVGDDELARVVCIRERAGKVADERGSP